MAIGGNFSSYNKLLPGAYINFVSKTRALGGISDRGILAFAFKTNWGQEDKIISLHSEDFEKKSLEILGYPYTSEQLKPIREIFKNASEIKFFRIGAGNKATATIDSLNVTAICGGTRGNSIKIKIIKDLDESNFTVCTYMQDTLVDEQTVTSINQLSNNNFVLFSGSGTVNSNAGVNLTGGTDSELNKEQYQKFLQLIEAESFNVLIYDGEDDVTKGLFTNFTKRLRDEEGVKFTTILHNYTKADYEGIISLKNDKQLIYWLGGALAGAKINESLTSKVYNGEYLFDFKFSNAELKSSIKNGEIVFYYDSGQIKILKDINTFTSFSAEKNSDFSNNQIIRILDSTANDIAKIFNNYYLGKIQNDSLGRDIFKAEIIDYFKNLQSIGAIDDFNDNDIEILKGNEKGDVILNILIEPISCMDKLYMKCIIE